MTPASVTGCTNLISLVMFWRDLEASLRFNVRTILAQSRSCSGFCLAS